MDDRIVLFKFSEPCVHPVQVREKREPDQETDSEDHKHQVMAVHEPDERVRAFLGTGPFVAISLRERIGVVGIGGWTGGSGPTEPRPRR